MLQLQHKAECLLLKQRVEGVMQLHTDQHKRHVTVLLFLQLFVTTVLATASDSNRQRQLLLMQLVVPVC
jgi:hypothetical protein